MKAWLRVVLLGAVLGLPTLTGCPGEVPAEAPPRGVIEGALLLRLGEGQALTVGERRPLELSFSSEEEQSTLFGALIGNVDSSQLTQWHAEPSEAVRFDSNDVTVTFAKRGPVEIWASWKSTEGHFVSNRLQLNVGEPDPSPQ